MIAVKFSPWQTPEWCIFAQRKRSNCWYIWLSRQKTKSHLLCEYKQTCQHSFQSSSPLPLLLVFFALVTGDCYLLLDKGFNPPPPFKASSKFPSVSLPLSNTSPPNMAPAIWSLLLILSESQISMFQRGHCTALLYSSQNITLHTVSIFVMFKKHWISFRNRLTPLGIRLNAHHRLGGIYQPFTSSLRAV